MILYEELFFVDDVNAVESDDIISYSNETDL